MAKEIERKFLVTGENYRQASSSEIKQGYLCSDPKRTVRVRTRGEKAFLTVKGKSEGASRDEFEYEIPADDANQMLDLLCECPIIEKRRYEFEFEGKVWEVDEFFGVNAGLTVAEIELSDEDEHFNKPAWIGDEVTSDSRYFNSNLILHPFSEWKKH